MGTSRSSSQRRSRPRSRTPSRLASASRAEASSCMYYVQHGKVPRQRHTQLRSPEGSLYAEELFGVEGFTGRSSLLYHLVPPTRTHKIEAVREIRLEAAKEDVHRHHLTKTGDVPPKGDAISGRIPLYFNRDV